MKKFAWFLFAFFAIGVGLYPIIYLLVDMRYGFLGTKSHELLSNMLWNITFYTHISLGGVSLFIGWTQFWSKLRIRRIKLHRAIGALYMLCVLLSGLSGLYIAFFATGGLVASLGFGGLAVSWLVTTSLAFIAIKKGRVNDHEKWMIRSYALTFAAVALRIMLPFSQAVLKVPFVDAYIVIAWACWVPNLIVAEWIIRKYTTPAVATEAN